MPGRGTASTPLGEDGSLPPYSLRARRLALGLTQEQLGHLLGVSGNTIARWERGKQRLANPQLVHLALERLELRANGVFLRAGRSVGGEARQHNLPAPLTSFIGRRREVRALRRLVITGRLVTVSGPAGVGKTRLALETARALAGHFPDGVWLVELAPVNDPSLTPQVVAAVLHVPDEPQQPRLETLVAALRDRHLLLVLDNCEHLVAACGELVVRLLRACPRLHVLVTSREILGLAGELVWPVPQLSLPTTDRLPDVDRLLRFEAVALFVERARAAAPAFILSQTNAAAVVEICRGLDGLPLALELAAARMSTLAADKLAARLGDRFRLLTNGPKSSPAHHETLEATIAWSYALLSAPERRLFERLAVFAGGWTVEAAEAVCSDDELGAADVLQLLTRLVDRSLVRAEPDSTGNLRFRLLETLRVYSGQALGAADRRGLEHRHAKFYLQLAEAVEPRLVRADQVEWATQLEKEMPNLRAALDWCLGHPQQGVPVGLRLASALAHFWQLGTHLQEGRNWLRRLLDAASAAPAERAGALWTDGFLAWQAGDLPGAAAAYGEGLRLASDSVETPYLSLLQIGLGTVLSMVRGDLTDGQALVEEGLARARERGERWTVGHALFWLGHIAHSRGDFARARTLFEESQIPARELGDRRDLAYVLMSQGYLALTTGDYNAGLQQFREALGMTNAVGDPFGTIWALEGTTAALSIRGQARLAALLLGAVEVQRATLGVVRDPVPGWHEVRERTQALVRRSLGERTFTSTVAAGRRLPLEMAVAEADGLAERRDQPAAAERSPRTLSRREREVARLVSLGLRNREIAERLNVAPSTVQRQVANILQKLAFNSRAEIAAWVASGRLESAAARLAG